ncbi:hypothetical protein [Aeromonas dhakensis]|uniref:phosphorylase family protein n=1 Tax=Aeromonas dhakensis TaxID=196024 RepID=UPI00300E5670
MKILILEDNKDKCLEIEQAISEHDKSICIQSVDNFSHFIEEINRNKYNLIIIDLVVPQFQDRKTTESDMSDRIVEALRHPRCPNKATPAFGLTEYLDKAEGNFANLNENDIVIITYNKETPTWKNLLSKKIIECTPQKTYDAVIICALHKEAAAYNLAGYQVGESFIYKTLSCNEIEIASGVRGVIVTLPKMGLVHSAIFSALSIEYFNPKIVCMSGICAGLPERTNIYDIVIPDICHQHDYGKWTDQGFKNEPSHIQIDHELKLKIEHCILRQNFKENIIQGINPKRSEIPEKMEEVAPLCYLAPASSGSAVIADRGISDDISSQSRKLSAFEMETFALYEAARTSKAKPLFFSAKSVVDNGDSGKSDEYHRIATIVSAKATFNILNHVLTT